MASHGPLPFTFTFCHNCERREDNAGCGLDDEGDDDDVVVVVAETFLF